MIRKEWKKLLRNKIMLLVIVAIIIIPTVYTTLFLGSMWDPYGKVDNLPVAVVNQDKEVTFENQVLHIGDDLVENLKDNDSLKFDFVDSTTANQGLEDGTYYMVITIPQDFSFNATIVMDKNPQKMELTYKTNPAHNYIASKMGENAVARIKESLNTEVTKVYLDTISDLFTEASDGMQKASDGAEKLQDGLTKVSDGAQSYTEGVNKIATGASQLAENNAALNHGISQLSSGVHELSDGSKKLINGLNTLSGSIHSTIPSGSDIAALGKGLDAYKSGINQLNTALNNFSFGNQGKEIGDSLSNIGSSTQAAAADVSAIGNAVKTLSQANLTKEQALALQTIVASTTDLGGHLSTIATDTYLSYWKKAAWLKL